MEFSKFGRIDALHVCDNLGTFHLHAGIRVPVCFSHNLNPELTVTYPYLYLVHRKTPTVRRPYDWPRLL